MEEAVRPNTNGNRGRLASSEVVKPTREGGNPISIYGTGGCQQLTRVITRCGYTLFGVEHLHEVALGPG